MPPKKRSREDSGSTDQPPDRSAAVESANNVTLFTLDQLNDALKRATELSYERSLTEYNRSINQLSKEHDELIKQNVTQLTKHFERTIIQLKVDHQKSINELQDERERILVLCNQSKSDMINWFKCCVK